MTMEQKEINKEFVDLGLPSGTKWAKCNIGAANEEEYGLYFQWGSKRGYSTEELEELSKTVKEDEEPCKDLVLYEFAESNEENADFIKYNNKDNKLVLDLEDDTAHALMGEEWRMPTKEDFEELINNTDVYIVLRDGEEVKGDTEESCIGWEREFPRGIIWNLLYPFKGVKFYNRNDKSKYIFIPSAGIYSVCCFDDLESRICLWSSTIGNEWYGQSYSLEISAYGGNVDDDMQDRRELFPIRGVLK